MPPQNNLNPNSNNLGAEAPMVPVEVGIPEQKPRVETKPLSPEVLEELRKQQESAAGKQMLDASEEQVPFIKPNVTQGTPGAELKSQSDSSGTTEASANRGPIDPVAEMENLDKMDDNPAKLFEAAKSARETHLGQLGLTHSDIDPDIKKAA